MSKDRKCSFCAREKQPGESWLTMDMRIKPSEIIVLRACPFHKAAFRKKAFNLFLELLDNATVIHVSNHSPEVSGKRRKVSNNAK